MTITFSTNAWEDYLYWQMTDKRILAKINQLIKAIQREPFSGAGKPEPLRYELSGYWSRRIDQQHRLVYQIREQQLIIIACRYHYD